MKSVVSSENALVPQIMPQNLTEIKDEIDRIAVHQREHFNSERILMPIDENCKFCQPYLSMKARPNHATNVLQSTDIFRRTALQDDSKPMQSNDLERTVVGVSKKGQIIVPRTWIGRRVRVTLLK